jgi:hypothetical protein
MRTGMSKTPGTPPDLGRDQLWPAGIGCRTSTSINCLEAIAWRQLLSGNCWGAINSVRGNPEDVGHEGLTFYP